MPKPRTGAAKARARRYRQSDAGRMARKFYLMDPEVKQRMALRRRIKQRLKGVM